MRQGILKHILILSRNMRSNNQNWFLNWCSFMPVVCVPLKFTVQRGSIIKIFTLPLPILYSTTLLDHARKHFPLFTRPLKVTRFDSLIRPINFKSTFFRNEPCLPITFCPPWRLHTLKLISPSGSA